MIHQVVINVSIRTIKTTLKIYRDLAPDERMIPERFPMCILLK